MKTKCLIVDDEPLAVEIIESYLNRLDNMEIIGSCNNAIKAFEVLQKQPVNLLFLDIQMPRLTGIDFLKTLKNPPKVILTTAYREYALESYELDVVDYLLKPISFERFFKAVSKIYRQEMTGNGGFREKEANATDNDPYLYLKADKKMVKVMLKDILYIESLKDYVRVKTPAKDVITHQTISYFEEKLSEDSFLRIHRSFIVPIGKIETFSASAVEVPGKELPIGRIYKNNVLKVLNELHHL
ncbi:response regulator transcription factor [Fulvivirga sp. M361]|uniref:LytR/AlgR family response regulator transcription factor n=1 Tax=Fulvivirga sp. M361 TaxID=2594266 RepID=UPI00117A90A7|nr:response regulator [Fulvivirga sp. M361]TRX61316.1 response regulator transcription factor [Fulvivirga sp. M361]